MQNFDSEKLSIERSARLHWLHWLVVAASLLLTFAAWYISRTSIEEKVSLQFERLAVQTVELVVERMQKYEDGLWGGVAAIDAMGGHISYDDWLTFASSLNIDLKYPGINGIGVIFHVPEPMMTGFMQAQRQRRPAFSIHPQHTRNDFWPITYIEPVHANAQAVGLDMAHETNRYQAALRARDTGLAQITGSINLVQDAGQTPGFLFYAPFYRPGTHSSTEQRQENIVGLVYAPFVVRKLMAGTLHQDNRQVSLRITDEGHVLYDEHQPSAPDYDPRPLFTRQLEVDMYGRTWIFDIRSALSFREQANNHQPMIILIGGIIIDSLLLALFILLAHSNRRAHALIQKMSTG